MEHAVLQCDESSRHSRLSQWEELKMGCDEVVFACSPLCSECYSDFTLQICDSQIMTAPSSTSLIIQNQTLTDLIRDVSGNNCPHAAALTDFAHILFYCIGNTHLNT